MREVNCMLNDMERQYWMYAPGYKACHWEADVDDGVMGLDMDDIPDLRGLSAECIARKMSRHRKCGNRFTGVGKYAVRFCRDVQVGDIVFAKRGLHELLGVGVVTGDYLPLPLRDEGIHTRAVRWFKPKKKSRKSFNFGQPAFYAVKKNDRAALFAAVGISEFELSKGRGARRGVGETGLSVAEKYALVDETRRACPKKMRAETEVKWQRDDRCVKTAIVHAKFKCERDGRHVTFMRENGNAYLEGHHLVGMRHQGLFKSVSLDNPANIVALCPNCHRLMHFGTDAERKKALKAFYKARKDRLAAAGINITEEKFVKLGLS